MTATLEVADAQRLAELILAAIHREYPHHNVHLMREDADVRPPRELHPAFHGSFDWHSAVHGHWALVRLTRLVPDAPWASRARAALAQSLTPERIRGEHAYMSVPGREGFERPYGLAWLLQLCAELRVWDDREARDWRGALEQLERLAGGRIEEWLRKLTWPIRSGEHSQTALALGLILDWARTAGDGLGERIEERARHFYLADRDAPIAYEPSGHDFLSPTLGEADLMRRVLPAEEFAYWMKQFVPDLEGPAGSAWLTPVRSPDRADGKLSHLDGLNLSRAWMLEGVASRLPRSDRRAPHLLEAAARHAEAGLGAVTGEHYAGAHWLGSFAVYLLTRRGLEA